MRRRRGREGFRRRTEKEKEKNSPSDVKQVPNFFPPPPPLLLLHPLLNSWSSPIRASTPSCEKSTRCATTTATSRERPDESLGIGKVGFDEG